MNYHHNKNFFLILTIVTIIFIIQPYQSIDILSFLLQGVPDEAKHISKEYEKCLADMVIMIAPFAPSFAEELWVGLSSVARSGDYLWVSLMRTLQYFKKILFGQKKCIDFRAISFNI